MVFIWFLFITNYRLNHTNKTFELEDGHQRNKYVLLILGYFQKIIIIFELFYSFLISFMFFIDLFLTEKVYFHKNIIYNVACKIRITLFMRKDSFFIRNVKLIDQYLHYLFRISFEINHQLSLLFPGNQVFNPFTSARHDLRSHLLSTIHWDGTETFVQKSLAWRLK